MINRRLNHGASCFAPRRPSAKETPKEKGEVFPRRQLEMAGPAVLKSAENCHMTRIREPLAPAPMERVGNKLRNPAILVRRPLPAGVSRGLCDDYLLTTVVAGRVTFLVVDDGSGPAALKPYGRGRTIHGVLPARKTLL